MKITKLMLSAFVAAAALVSCNKENHTPETTGLKTVEMSVANLVMTRGLAGEKINEGDAMNIKDFQIFLTDATYSNVYHDGVKGDNNAAPKFYWSSADLAANPDMSYNYHFVSHHCTKVVAVANFGKQLASLEDALKHIEYIKGEQNADDLLLFGEGDVVADPNGATHSGTDENGDSYYSFVYTSNPVLTPTIARFEVDGFVMNFNESEINSVTITDILFQDYLPSMTYGVPGGNYVEFITDLDDDAQVYSWFNTNNDDDSSDTWYRDSFALTLERPSEGTIARADIEDADGNPTPLAYHLFAPAKVPDMVIKMSTTGKSGASDAYIWTDIFNYTNENHEVVTLQTIEPGTIYRMSAAGEARKDGSIPFNEEDLKTVDRCLVVNVDVKKWDVVLVTPEF